MTKILKHNIRRNYWSDFCDKIIYCTDFLSTSSQRCYRFLNRNCAYRCAIQSANFLAFSALFRVPSAASKSVLSDRIHLHPRNSRHKWSTIYKDRNLNGSTFLYFYPSVTILTRNPSIHKKAFLFDAKAILIVKLTLLDNCEQMIYLINIYRFYQSNVIRIDQMHPYSEHTHTYIV